MLTLDPALLYLLLGLLGLLLDGLIEIALVPLVLGLLLLLILVEVGVLVLQVGLDFVAKTIGLLDKVVLSDVQGGCLFAL